MSFSRKVELWTLRLLIFGISALNLGPAKAQSSEFLYQQDPEHIVVEYQRRSTYPYYGEPKFGLRLFGDGRIIATLPEKFPQNAIKKRNLAIERRGAFEMRLTSQEMTQLLQDIEPSLLIDPMAMKQERKKQKLSRGRTDGAVTKLAVRLVDYRPALGEWAGSIDLSVEWLDVYGDTRLYPNVAGIQALGHAERELSQWVFRIAARAEALEQSP